MLNILIPFFSWPNCIFCYARKLETQTTSTNTSDGRQNSFASQHWNWPKLITFSWIKLTLWSRSSWNFDIFLHFPRNFQEIIRFWNPTHTTILPRPAGCLSSQECRGFVSQGSIFDLICLHSFKYFHVTVINLQTGSYVSLRDKHLYLTRLRRRKGKNVTPATFTPKINWYFPGQLQERHNLTLKMPVKIDLSLFNVNLQHTLVEKPRCFFAYSFEFI